jgi:hypothetical protein
MAKKRFFHTTDIPTAEKILFEGFFDQYKFGSMEGVWFADCPLAAYDGFDGDVILCLDISEDDYKRYEWVEEPRDPGYRKSLLPAAFLNTLDKPQIYDHLYAGSSRRELLQAIRKWEEAGGNDELLGGMRAAFGFFDRIGWLTPVNLREEKAPEG